MYDWQKKYPRLLSRIEEAREKARQKALATIKRFGETDYKAAAEFLRLSFAQDYMRGKYGERPRYERRRRSRSKRSRKSAAN